MERHADRPFFVYLAHSFPHVPLWASNRFAGTTERGLYGDVIAEIDWSVGEILATLDRLDIEDRTLVVFTSDNGPWLVFGNHSGSAGPFREGKATTFEGGHRVPGLFRWPGRIPAGVVTDELATGMDLLPTLARIVGAAVPSDRVIDGHDIWPLLSGDPDAVTPYTEFFYYRGGRLQAVRSGRWKLHVPHTYPTLDGGEPGQDGSVGRYGRGRIGVALFDLAEDRGETRDVALDHPQIVERLLGLIDLARADIGDASTETIGANARPAGAVDVPWEVQVKAGNR
jgi:arylsulfatase/arylsulfatase A